jgi:hypothetical protein
MKTNQILFGLALLAAGLTLSGCYTQFATNERDPYADGEQGYTTQDTSGAAGYTESRERFYSDYYMTAPTLTIGATFWDPWGYPGYGYGAWWCYNPWYNPYYPIYPGYWPGAYYPYYPYYGTGGGYYGYHAKPAGVRTFGSGRYTGSTRGAASGGTTTSAGTFRPTTSSNPSFLPAGVRAVSPRGGSTSAREGGSRPAPTTTPAPTRTGSARDHSRGERMPAYTPPPPPSRESPRHGGERPSNGSYSPPPPASHSAPPPSSSSPQGGGGRTGGGESGSGGGRSGSRR